LCGSCDEELTIGSPLARRDSRILYAAPGSESTLACSYSVRTNSDKGSNLALSRLTAFRRTKGESAPLWLLRCAFDECPDLLVTFFSDKLHKRSQ
jgi:hypothetical protein